MRDAGPMIEPEFDIKCEKRKATVFFCVFIPAVAIAIILVINSYLPSTPTNEVTKVVVVGKSTVGVDKWGDVQVETYVKPLGTLKIRTVCKHPLYFMSKVGDTVEVRTYDLLNP
jgi:hypothetical protein